MAGRPMEDAGATMLNTGIGWHEARVPTIVTTVPRASVRVGYTERLTRRGRRSR